jgi:hypothetical protein
MDVTEGQKEGRKEGRMDGCVTISLCNFVGEGIKTTHISYCTSTFKPALRGHLWDEDKVAL